MPAQAIRSAVTRREDLQQWAWMKALLAAAFFLLHEADERQ